MHGLALGPRRRGCVGPAVWLGCLSNTGQGTPWRASPMAFALHLSLGLNRGVDVQGGAAPRDP